MSTVYWKPQSCPSYQRFPVNLPRGKTKEKLLSYSMCLKLDFCLDLEKFVQY